MSFKTKLFLLLLIGNLLGSVLFTFSTLSTHRESTRRSIDRTLLRAALSASYIVGEEYHERVLSDYSIKPEEYLKNTLLLHEVAGKMEVRYLYSMTEKDGKIFFTSSGASKEEMVFGLFENFLKEYQFSSPELKKSFETMSVVFDESGDEYGFFRSIYIPKQTRSGKKFVIGADIPVSAIEAKQWELLKHYILQGMLFFLIPSLLVFFLLQKISRRLVKLSDFTKSLITQNFAPSADVMSGLEEVSRNHLDEIGQISNSLINMQKALGQHIKALEKTTSIKEKIESEVRIARQIQRSILPKKFPPFYFTDRVEIYATLHPAKEVGGDFFDYVFLPDGKVLLFVGDVSGKGIPAAFFMAMTSTFLRTHGRQKLTPEKTLIAANQDLCRENELGMFATVFCGLLDLKTLRLDYAQAGHNPPVILKESGIDVLPEGGIPLGVKEEAEFLLGTCQLCPGDLIFLYTDGVTEALNADGKLFSDERLFEILKNSPRKNPDFFVAGLNHEVHEFARGVPQEDDIMIMGVRIPKSSPKQTGRFFNQTFFLKNSVEELEKVHDFLKMYWSSHFLPDFLFQDVIVIIEEAISNIIRYGFPQGEESKICLQIGVVGGIVFFELQDEGIPFDPTKVRTVIRKSSIEEKKEGGLGIFLIKKLSDSVEYQHKDGKNVLRMWKSIESKETISSSFQKVEDKMKIEETEKEEVMILAVSGRIDTQTAPELEEKLLEVIENGFLKIILDLTSLDFITSAGLRVLLQASKKVQPQQGKLAVVGMDEIVQKVFKLTGFLNIFPHFATLDEGLEKIG